jgi:hypothetical protein
MKSSEYGNDSNRGFVGVVSIKGGGCDILMTLQMGMANRHSVNNFTNLRWIQGMSFRTH